MKDYKKQFKIFIQENHMTFITPGIQRRLYPFLNRLVDEAKRERMKIKFINSCAFLLAFIFTLIVIYLGMKLGLSNN